MCGERIFGGRGDAKRVGSRDWRIPRALERELRQPIIQLENRESCTLSKL